MEEKSTLKSFNASPHFSIKHTNYFEIYDTLLSQFIDREIIFLEVGVLDGGSLFMWRDFFGENARIIGVDLNPEAIKWRDYGFEIYIGNQSDPKFWSDLFKTVGTVDVILDDGGHRNDQQIATLTGALPHVKDGGLIIVEDTQTSFMKFESFQKYSFVGFLKTKIKSLYARSDELVLSSDIYSKTVHSIEFFTGICVLHIDRTKCANTQRIENDGARNNSDDFRYDNDGRLLNFLRFSYDWISWDHISEKRLKKYPLLCKFLKLKIIRFILRIFIVPIRFFFYLQIRVCNFFNLRRILKG